MKFTTEDYENWPYADINDFIKDTGHWLTRDAFFETAGTDKSNVRYTLRMVEWEGYPSAYQIILHADSLYDAAMKLCGDWSMFQRWLDTKALAGGATGQNYKGVGLLHAVEAHEQKLVHDGLQKIKQKAKEGHYQANKDLVMWNVKKQKTGKKVQEVPETGDDVVSIVERIDARKSS